MKFYIWTNGDASVGIAGDRAEVNIDAHDFDNDEEAKEFVDMWKGILSEAFSRVWEFKVHVMIEGENLD